MSAKLLVEYLFYFHLVTVQGFPFKKKLSRIFFFAGKRMLFLLIDFGRLHLTSKNRVRN